MRVHPIGLPIGLLAGAVLLVAAQDAPPPPPDGASFSEAFAEQSNAAKAVETADKLEVSVAETAAEPTPQADAEPQPETKPEPATEPKPEPEAEPVPAPEPTVTATEPAAQSAAEPAPAPAPAPETAPTDTAPKAAKGDPVTHDFLVGVWAEKGKSCEAGIDFQADGKMIGPFPRWELADGELTMVGNRQKMRLTVVDQDTIQSRRSETDPPRILTRCAKAPPPPKP